MAENERPGGWVKLRHLRWRGFRMWHRVGLGPLRISAYIYAPSERRRPFLSHGWRYRNADGEWRHTRTFRRLVARRREAMTESIPMAVFRWVWQVAIPIGVVGGSALIALREVVRWAL